MKTATRKIVRGATAFNETAILQREGRQGFHLVDFGILRLDFEQSRRPWEHRRLIMPSPKTLAAMQADGPPQTTA